MKMEIREYEGRLICILSGHLDTPQSQKLEEALKARLTKPQPVEFEMREVTYVCSAFLRVCLFVAKTVGAGHFTLLGLTPPIKRVFKIAGMSELCDCK